MNSTELVSKVLKGENTSHRVPVYGWLGNLDECISQRFGSITAFEDAYEFDMAHIFGGPSSFDIDYIRSQIGDEELTPQVLLDFTTCDADNEDSYKDIISQMDHYKARDRFCYMQTNGIFEALNGVFGIENHLMYMALYPDELMEVYKRQAEFNIKTINNFCSLGVDMIHVSDDWGAQRSLMFSPQFWWDMIFPFHKEMVDAIKKNSKFASLHSDGNIMSVLDGVVQLGYDAVHPFQKSAGMSYDVYLEKYSDAFAVFGGLCIQTVLGHNNYPLIKQELDDLFTRFKDKRLLFCTTHFVQTHCGIDELVYAYDYATKLARG